ncbi:tyrosine-protein phosphatase [Myroides odoratimimus]|uniref:tyrosine-protein phosphatase n=2 Tax=Myroides odoratimimus TaxID=76832 RepID=UPI00103E0790|nr:tyrosine-protein phosphatase [Myroides odoratimimus]MDM1035140.1 tyrosine-protein phosphatase [Myroides odoratimimus]MDM1093985.1 tyrosine-protein phosphatase [Myroides odoratimimus]MDM1412370.1 tyrosine-protein phosphatase [Myroides odoratimimus]MDM1415454.1 tyrosine-protein phosphatase [Myroides odoratimimus]MDM1447794.1 tyrosine-protein phosphatase [Myroides odoratimimus]
MRYYTLFKIIFISTLFVGCSYQTYQPIFFSDLDKNDNVTESKKGYMVQLTPDEKLVLDQSTHVETEVGQYFVKTNERQVFPVISNHDTVYRSNRHIEFKKVHNFRDMGGIRNKDGKQVIWGHFFRSGHLSKLKEKEYAKLENLNVKTVIDLRTDKEVTKKPDRVPEGVVYKNVQVYDDSEDMFSKTKKDVLKGKVTPVQSDSLVMEFYKLYMTETPQLVREIMDDVFESKEAVLFHCSAGKDRTGMIGAMILSILEVERETIISEYMLSNNYRVSEVEGRMKLAKVGKVIFPKINYQVIENFSWIKPIYIQAMFEGIEKEYGSVDNYIEQGLKISKEKRAEYIQKFTY